MPLLEFPCELEHPIERVWRFHDSIDTLPLLSPPNTQVHLDGTPVPMAVGVIYRLRIRRMGLPLRWDAEIIAYDPPNGFIDRQVTGRGPFAFWEHQHLFTALTPQRTLMLDKVQYTPPFGLLGRLADILFIRRDLRNMFAHRHRITRQELQKIADSQANQP